MAIYWLVFPCIEKQSSDFSGKIRINTILQNRAGNNFIKLASDENKMDMLHFQTIHKNSLDAVYSYF